MPILINEVRLKTFFNADEFLHQVARDNYPKRVSIDFKEYDFHCTHVKTISRVLESGKCPPGFAIRLNATMLFSHHIQPLIHALETGKCPQGLLISFRGSHFCWEEFAQALESGKCPQGLSLRISSCFISNREMQAITRALESGKCPQGFSISLKYILFFNYCKKFLARALESGNCPQGFAISFRAKRYDIDFVPRFARALATRKCPRGLSISFRGPLHSASIEAIANALKSDNCPEALSIKLHPNTAIASADMNKLLAALQEQKHFLLELILKNASLAQQEQINTLCRATSFNEQALTAYLLCLRRARTSNNSHFTRLPPELIHHIFSFVIPIRANTLSERQAILGGFFVPKKQESDCSLIAGCCPIL